MEVRAGEVAVNRDKKLIASKIESYAKEQEGCSVIIFSENANFALVRSDSTGELYLVALATVDKDFRGLTVQQYAEATNQSVETVISRYFPAFLSDSTEDTLVQVVYGSYIRVLSQGHDLENFRQYIEAELEHGAPVVDESQKAEAPEYEGNQK